MKNKMKNKINKGFTIIEVIIVLVIAAIIMLAVFLVVPQLQRAQRNNRRQQDGRAVLTAMVQHQANNNGTALTSAAQITDITGTVNAPATTTAYTYVVQADSTAAAAAASTNLNTIVAATGGTICSGAAFASGTGSAVIVRLETATTTPVNFCVAV